MTKLAQEYHLVKHFFIGEQLLIWTVELRRKRAWRPERESRPHPMVNRREERRLYRAAMRNSRTQRKVTGWLAGKFDLHKAVLDVEGFRRGVDQELGLGLFRSAGSFAQHRIAVDLDISPLFDLPARPIDPELRELLVATQSKEYSGIVG